MKEPLNSKIILFDGYCNLCSGFVQFLLRHDRRQKFRFASLQGKFGQQLLHQQGMPASGFDTFIYSDNGRLYTRSTGVLRIVKELPGAWPLLYPFIWVPVFIRDGVYNWVARNRYVWFGKKPQCWLPRPEWEGRFID